jgi:hypothetical protein
MNGRFRTGLWALALLSLGLAAQAAKAQTNAATNQTGAPNYDAAKEITIKATVASVVENAGRGMFPGSHLMLQTSRGIVDASIGKWGLKGEGALKVGEGETVEATGVLAPMAGTEVFLVRTVKAGGQTYLIRNEHGYVLNPVARERASRNSGATGGGL